MARRIHVPWLYLSPRYVSQASVWESKSMTATGPRERVARRCGSVQAWSPPMSTGTTPASTMGATSASMAA